MKVKTKEIAKKIGVKSVHMATRDKMTEILKVNVGTIFSLINDTNKLIKMIVIDSNITDTIGFYAMVDYCSIVISKEELIHFIVSTGYNFEKLD
jgi:hypothetical protein